MAHFTTQDSLKAFLDATQISTLFAKVPIAQQEDQFNYADSVITAATGVVPAGTGNDPILVSIASRVVIWMLSGNQQWNDTNKPELDRREKLYNAAMLELEDYAPPKTTDQENADVDSNYGSYYKSLRNPDIGQDDFTRMGDW